MRTHLLLCAVVVVGGVVAIWDTPVLTADGHRITGYSRSTIAVTPVPPR